MLESPFIVLPSLVWISLMYFGGPGAILQKILENEGFPDGRRQRSCRPTRRKALNDANSEPRKSCRDSVLLCLAELLESRIGAQGIPDRIEPKKRRRNGPD